MLLQDRKIRVIIRALIEGEYQLKRFVYLYRVSIDRNLNLGGDLLQPTEP